jgi:hypothetical protein
VNVYERRGVAQWIAFRQGTLDPPSKSVTPDQGGIDAKDFKLVKIYAAHGNPQFGPRVGCKALAVLKK